MDNKFQKLVDFIEKTFKSDTNIEPLQHLVEEEFELSEIPGMVEQALKRPDAYQILCCVFLGLTQKPLSQKKCFKVIETITTNLITAGESRNQNASKIVSKVTPELDKLKTLHLVKLTDVCVEVIRNPECSSKTSWKEILPRIFNLLSGKKDVTYAGSDMTGTEFISEVLKNLYKMNVCSEIIIPLTSMFSEIPMNNSEHEAVVSKMCEMLGIVPIRHMPNLVQELLRLCKEDHIIIVFLKLQKYFVKNLHSLEVVETNKLTDDMKEIMDAETEILYHIEEFARISRLLDLLKLCKNASNASCLLLDPFLFSVLLVLSCNPSYETQVNDLLRTMITQIVTEEERKKESAWLSYIIESKFNIDELFSRTIQSRLCDHEKVVEGLTNLGFTLLSVSGIKSKETILKKIWRIGRITLVSLIKKHRKITKSVLQNLTDRIITGCTSQQYTDCLLHLCTVASSVMVDNFPVVVRILEFINSMPSVVSQRIITALIPLIQISSNLRDSLILCLRKALFSCNIEIRQVAVLGFLQLLKFLKLQRVSAYSQNTLTQTTFHGPSVFTQICMDVHSQQTMSQQSRLPMNPNINEAICLEVVGILKRCFMQQASVKTTLYKGLFSAICVNPQLCTLVLDVLLDHFGQFYENEDDVLPPIAFDRTLSVRNSVVSLEEPIGQLVLLIQDVLGRTNTISTNPEIEDDEATKCVQKFTCILSSLVDRFSRCDLNNFQIDENSNISDTSCESMKLQEILKQIVSVYEALMAYVINSWNSETSPDIARKLVGLHKVYHLIAVFVKNAEKNKKKDKDLSKDTTKEGDTSGLEKKKKTTKKEKTLSVPKKCFFKLPSTILSLKTVERLLSLFLLDEIEWITPAALQELKSRRRLFAYSMNSALEGIGLLKQKLYEEPKSSVIFQDIVKLSSLIFLRGLSRYNEIIEFDAPSAVTAVECFSEMFSLMFTHYHSKFSQFLEESIYVPARDGLPKQLLPVLKVYKNLLNLVLSSSEKENYVNEDDDVFDANKRLAPILIDALRAVVLALPANHEVTKKVCDWLVSIAEKHQFPNTNDSKSFMDLLFSMHYRCRSDLTLLDSLCTQLCHIFPPIAESSQENAVRPLLMLSESSKTVIFPKTCLTLISQLDDVDYMITRFKSENLILSYLQDDEDNPQTQCSILKRRERELCQQVTHVTIMTQTLISVAAPTGPCLESLIKFLTRTFSIITALTKYFIQRSTAAEPVYRNALFHKLVKIAGSQFIRQEASELILYVEKDYENESRKSLSHLNNQAKKQFVLLPKLVSELESFPKAVLQLSKKCKDSSLSNQVKLTITRDFRLNVKKVDELISKQNESDSEEDEEMNDPPLLSSTRISQEPSQKRRRTS